MPRVVVRVMVEEGDGGSKTAKPSPWSEAMNKWKTTLRAETAPKVVFYQGVAGRQSRR